MRLFTNDSGGILDDLMVANLGDHLFLVVNAACKDADEAHLRDHLSKVAPSSGSDDRALLALQGPKAHVCSGEICADVAGDALHGCARRNRIDGDPDCFVSRSGYTGEDGFEISVPADKQRRGRGLLDDPDVMPIGLGARDSLRLEAGLCLYGHDIDADDHARRSRARMVHQKSRREGGARAGGFPGRSAILPQFDEWRDRAAASG